MIDDRDRNSFNRSSTEILNATAELIKQNNSFLNRIKYFLKKLFEIRETALIFIIIITVAILSLLSNAFFHLSNFISISRGFSMEGIVAIGMTFLLISGGFDLSVASVMALTGVITGWFLVKGVNIWLAIILGFIGGGIIGLINGLVVTKAKVNPLIATLGMMSIVRALALVLTQGKPISGFPKEFIKIGQGNLFIIPISVVVLIILLIICDICLRKARFFRQFYYIGGNENAARASGIVVDQVKIITYILCSLAATLGGIISTARLTSAIPTSFEGAELRIISACVIGGASLAGGEGTVVGSILGLIFMALITNGMVILGVSVYWQGVAMGTILILAVAIDMISRKRMFVA